jgi:hypothetical protein
VFCGCGLNARPVHCHPGEAMIAKQAIIERLKKSPEMLAIHEMGFLGHSQTAISARLREMRREGLVCGSTRPGKKFKQWGLNPLIGIGPEDQRI